MFRLCSLFVVDVFLVNFMVMCFSVWVVLLGMLVGVSMLY